MDLSKLLHIFPALYQTKPKLAFDLDSFIGLKNSVKFKDSMPWPMSLKLSYFRRIPGHELANSPRVVVTERS